MTKMFRNLKKHGLVHIPVLHLVTMIHVYYGLYQPKAGRSIVCWLDKG